MQKSGFDVLNSYLYVCKFFIFLILDYISFYTKNAFIHLKIYVCVFLKKYKNCIGGTGWHKQITNFLNITVSRDLLKERNLGVLRKYCLAPHQLCNLSFQWHLWNLCNPFRRWGKTVTVQGYFWHILQLALLLDSPGAQNQPKMPLHSNCHSTAPIWAAKVPKVPL